MQSDTTQKLIELFELEKIDQHFFRANCLQMGGTHIFGGQLLAQALVAAAKTTQHREAHSLHGYFIKSGNSHFPILYEVMILRDGQSFATRQVYAYQDGEILFYAMVSFAKTEQGLEYQKDHPDYPAPETLAPEQQYKLDNAFCIPEHYRDIYMRNFNIDVRPTEFVIPAHGDALAPKYAEYLKTYQTIEGKQDQNIMHQAIAAYYSDYNLLSVSFRPHGINYLEKSVRTLSLDHAIYFHRPFRVDQWVLYETNTTLSAQTRAMNYGQMWQDGHLVCSTTQESLIRKRS
ncbi:thioesterase family protein [Acinetobacter gerneri]|uniref:acyl-CoA thioesterase domain-containing protein n=1 Tax=Acinetobacter gerneri TaxID=202952 RepID=UPI002935E3A2|nr:acyl-CoA thioesterase domain-containing protein [Acinetobacter gerneri]MDV2440495.1 thioesterase family protein [Acinetobacter gerneri]